MSYLQGIVRKFAEDITRNKKYNYSDESLSEYLMQHPEIDCLKFKVENNRHQNIQTLLLKSSNSNKCIVYAHGLGSNKLEVLNIANYYLKQGFDICSFDFSSSGKSDGYYTSYGLLQQDDIHAILEYLDKIYSYNKYILWGRSMGSVSIILSQGSKFNNKVQSIILDSPFSSFEKIVVEIASKKSFIPQFMIELLIQPLKKYFSESYPINPFQINIIQRVKKIDCKILLIYSKNDSIINYKHALQLGSNCKKIPIEIEIKQDHNMQRSKQTYQRILRFINNCSYQAERKLLSKYKNRGISVASKQKMFKQNQNKSNTKIKICYSISKNNFYNNESGSNCSKSFKTVSSLNENSQLCNRLQTQIQSTKRRKIGQITSLCIQNKHISSNKQNMKPSLNIMRKNRFR